MKKPDPMSKNSPVMEEVDGVRCMWGTMKGCTSRTILMVLQKTSTVVEKVKVCWKFKKNTNNTVQWWFLIHEEEGVLQVLQQEREVIQIQASWKLELCHRPVQSNDEKSLGDKSPFYP